MARRHEDASPAVLRDLQRGDGDRPADPQDQYRLAGRHLCLGHHHPPGGEEDKRKSRRLFEAQAVRDRPEIGLREDHRLREGPVAVLAEDLPAVTQRVLATGAVVAGAITQPGVEEDPAADGVF